MLKPIKYLLLSIFTIFLISCENKNSHNADIANSSLASQTNNENASQRIDQEANRPNTKKNSIYYPYDPADVEEKLNLMNIVIDNPRAFKPEEVEEARTNIDGWRTNPKILKAMMESNIQVASVEQDEIEDGNTPSSLDTEAPLNIKWSAFSDDKAQGVSLLKIQSADSREFEIKSYQVNQGACKPFFGEDIFPIKMKFGKVFSTFLGCNYSDILEVTIITDKGSLTLRSND